MSVRHHDRSHDVSNDNHSIERVATSTRILLDSASRPECLVCGETIEYDTQYKCVTVRDGAGTVSERLFCDESCLHDQFEEIDPRV